MNKKLEKLKLKLKQRKCTKTISSFYKLWDTSDLRIEFAHYLLKDETWENHYQADWVKGDDLWDDPFNEVYADYHKEMMSYHFHRHEYEQSYSKYKETGDLYTLAESYIHYLYMHIYEKSAWYSHMTMMSISAGESYSDIEFEEVENPYQQLRRKYPKLAEIYETEGARRNESK